MRTCWVWMIVLVACGKSEEAGPRKDTTKAQPPDAAPAPAPAPPKPASPWWDELADAPVAISAVEAKQVDGSADPYLSIHFTLTSRRAITERTVLMVRAACKVGELVMKGVAAPLVELRQLAVAETKALEAIPFGLNGFAGTADPCELGFFLDRQEAGVKPARFHTACWSAGVVAEGPCTALAPKPGGASFHLASAELALDGDHLRASATITAGVALVGDEQPRLDTRCEIAGQVVSAEVPTIASFTYTSPGESLRVAGTVPAASPTWCELSVAIDRLVSGPAIELGKRCLRDSRTSDGACGARSP